MQRLVAEGGDLEVHSGVMRGAGGKEEPDRARWMEGRGKAGEGESHSRRWMMTYQGGMRVPGGASGIMGHGGVQDQEAGGRDRILMPR